ncbi:hypothetical protein F7R01_21600 [Pseudomonas argentinensis]|nr:hypothetical protein F7R01_21600 [Pseudomonas argentinensis]
MARFPAQPVGPGPFWRDAAFLAGSFSSLNFAARALPRDKRGSGAAVRETATDPRELLRYRQCQALLHFFHHDIAL